MSKATDKAAVSRATDEAWQKRTLWDLLSEHARTRPEKEALVNVDTLGRESRVTYGQLAQRVRAASAAWAGIGVRRGDRVGLWMTNLVEWAYSYFGALRIGAVVVPMNTFLKAPEIAYILRKAGARHLVMLDRFRKIDFTEVLSQMAPEWPSSKAGHLASRTLPELRSVVIFNRSGQVASDSAYDWQSLMANSQQFEGLADEMAARTEPHDLALIKFTSGSTGFPKGAMLEQWGVVTNSLLHTRRLGITDKDKWFSMMPLFHAGGSIWGLMTMFSRGGTLVFTEANDGELAARLIDEEGATCLTGVGPMLHDIITAVRAQKRTYTKLWLSVAADASLIPSLRELFGVTNLYSAYGMTEVYGPAALTARTDPVARQERGEGKPLDGQELRIVDPASGEDAAPGSIGEVWMRGLVMRGYHEMPEQNAQTIDEEGWIHSQDLAVMDKDGYVRYVGRIKAMLKVGGENVAVEEVENVIRLVPGVVDTIVIGVPDDRYGEVPRAYLIRAAGAEIDPEAVRRWCAEHLGRFKVPRDYIVVDTLPMTGSGKIDRAAVIRQDREAAGLQHIQA
jgi:fatty-acyl-CoA synthase